MKKIMKFFSEVKKEGTMKAAINNRNGVYSIGFSISKEYQPLADSFKTNGANVSMDDKENNVVKVSGDKIEMYSVLDNTVGTLKAQRNTTMLLSNNKQYVKKLQQPVNNQAAMVNKYFLIVTLVMEILLIGFYFIVLY